MSAATFADKDRNGLGGLQYSAGRPKLEDEVKALSGSKGAGLVFTCGPEAMVNECSVLAMANEVDFRQEVFMF